MTKDFQLPAPDTSPFTRHIANLRSRLSEQLANLPPERIAAWSGAHLLPAEQGEIVFELDFWGQKVRLQSPDWMCISQGENQELAPPDQALILYYLVTADGAPLEGSWISFSDLPDGRFYVKAFQGYTGKILASIFQNDLKGLKAAALIGGGVLQERLPGLPGDLAFVFPALPRLSLLLAYWTGDEDFPASAQILFPDATPHYLPTDVCAYLGSSLVRRLRRTTG